MNKFILGTKGRMTQIFDEKGRTHPVTVLSATPNIVTQIKTKDTDGYVSVQLGLGERKGKNVSKPVRGHLKAVLGENKDNLFPRSIREFRVSEDVIGTFEIGKTIDVATFEAGDEVDVSAISKGKGFQGTVKRHGFAGGPRSHGQKHSERAPGSIGAQGPQRVLPGKKMSGRMGNDRVTIKNLKVMHVDADRNELYISGAIPGRPGSLVEVRST